MCRLWRGIPALMFLALGACAMGYDAPPLDTGPQATSGGTLSKAYRLGVGDKLKVSVFGEDDLSGTFDVNAAGNVPMPLIGEIPARGRPIHDFQRAVSQKLASGYLKQPKVSVEVLNYRPIYIHGEVRKGGEFPFKSGLRIRDAIALAGGYTYRANKSHILITREGHDREYSLSTPTSMDVLPGDNIRVPERFF